MSGMDDRADSALKLAKAQLEDKLSHILVNNTVPLNATRLHMISTSLVPCSSHCFQTSTVPPLDGVNNEVENYVSAVSFEFNGELDLDLVHPAAIYELKKIADYMIQSGYEKECCLVYSSVRSHVLGECLRMLGIERYSIEEVQKMEWKTLHDQMGKWIKAMKILVKRLLTSEKFLCEQVFTGSESMREVCFVECSKGCVMQMLNFSKAVAISQRSSEKLFSILDAYDALSNVMPDLEELFNGDSGAGEMLCSEAKGVLEGFCMAATATFVEFERAVREETPASKMLENGDVHPLTQYVMSYVKLLVEYSEILNGVFEKTDDNSEKLQNDEVENVERMPCITRRLLSLVKSLESNLEEKSRMYEDGGLQSVFLMNNVLYIVNQLKHPEVRDILGDRCISKRRDQIRHYALSYLRSSWTNALNCLHVEGFPERKDLALRVRNFNAYFEDAYRIQRAWKVADPMLREELRILISTTVIPIYRTFLGRFHTFLTRSRDGIRRYIKELKHTPEDLSNYLLDFFEDCAIQRRNCLCS